jgi:hypothetical protein
VDNGVVATHYFDEKVPIIERHSYFFFVNPIFLDHTHKTINKELK